ncbi:MAG: preprotein translocase subunit SecG [Bacteroidales bacterium]|nr:preprotein translocase subunit SecG [Candidatus Colimorpha onthohippi]
MYSFIVILILIVCVLLALVVLVQNSKGGGLAANFSAPNQIMGVRRTADFLEKATWWLAILLVVFSLAATITIPRNEAEESLENTVHVETPVQASQAAPATAAPAEATAPVNPGE